MPEKYYMAPSMNTTGSSVITYGQNIYYGGQNLVIDKDVTADNIYILHHLSHNDLQNMPEN